MCRLKRYVLANGPRLSGKCVSPETLVFTPKGLVPIGALGHAQDDLFSPISEVVMSMDGRDFRTAKADQFYNSGDKASITLKTNRGYELTCSGHHPVWCEHGGKIAWMTSKEIKAAKTNGHRVWVPLIREHPGDWTCEYQSVTFSWFSGQESAQFDASERINHATQDHADIKAIAKAAKSAISTVKKWLHRPFKPRVSTVLVDEDFAYAIGLMVGDGCYTNSVLDSCFLTFSSIDYEIISQFSSILGERFPDFSLTTNPVVPCNHTIRSASFRAFIKETGMAGKYSHEKDVPDFILRSPKSVVRAFLQGLFDTDGTAGKNHDVTYCTTSDKLARQVQTLLLALGVRTTKRFKRNDFKGAWILFVATEDDFPSKVGFRLLRKQSRTVHPPKKWKIHTSAYPPSFTDLFKRVHAQRRQRGVGTLPRATHRLFDNFFRGNVAVSRKRIEPLLAHTKALDLPEIQDYIMSWKVWWDEIVSCDEGHCQLVDISVPATHNFVGNGFVNHNSIGALFCLADHAWEVRDANIAIITVTQTVGLNSGIWVDLCKVLDERMRYIKEFHFVKEPYSETITKKPTCIVNNQDRQEIKIQLWSCKNEQDVEGMFKGPRFTMIYVPELSSFKSRKTFQTWCECLRMPQELGMTRQEREKLQIPDTHLFLGDTNPADEGEDSWIYQLWFTLLGADEKDLGQEDRTLRNCMGRVDFTLADNIFDTEARIELLKGTYKSDPDLYRRYINGIWVKASEDAIFYKHFSEQLHVQGTLQEDGKDNDVVVPGESCYELNGGWDLGDMNCAYCIIEPWEKPIRRTVEGEDGKIVTQETMSPGFTVLDELVILGRPFDLVEFVDTVMEMRLYWETILGRPGKVKWTDWSDRNVFNVRSFDARIYLNQAVAQASGGAIRLQGAFEAQRSTATTNSVGSRIGITRKLLFEERIVVARKCQNMIDMFKAMRAPRPRVGEPPTDAIARHSKFKHIFDAGSYVWCSECYGEMRDNFARSLRRSSPKLMQIRYA